MVESPAAAASSASAPRPIELEKLRPAAREIHQYAALVLKTSAFAGGDGGFYFEAGGSGRVKVSASAAYEGVKYPQLRGRGVVELHMQLKRLQSSAAVAELVAAGVLPEREAPASKPDLAALGGAVGGVKREVEQQAGKKPAPVEVIQAATLERENILAARGKTLPVSRGLLDADGVAKLKGRDGGQLPVVPLDAQLNPQDGADYTADADAWPGDAAGFGARLRDMGYAVLEFRAAFMAQGDAVQGEDDPYEEDGDALTRVRSVQMAIAASFVCRKAAVSYQTTSGDWHVLLDDPDGKASADVNDLWMRCGLFAWPAPWARLLGGDSVVPLFVRSRPRSEPELLIVSDAWPAAQQLRTDEILPIPDHEAYQFHLTNPFFIDED